MDNQTVEIRPIDETAHVSLLAEPTPHHIQAYREADTARMMYPGASEFATAVPDNLFDGADATQAQAKTAISELRKMFADTGIAPIDAQTIMSRAGAASRVNEADAKRETRALFLQTFGTDAGQALADAKTLVARDPRFKRLVDVRGIGNDAKSALILAHAARSLKMNNRL